MSWNDAEIEKCAVSQGLASLKVETLQERTQRQIFEMQAVIEEKKELLTLLQNNPEIERVFTLLSRTTNY